jgi:predicted GNAT family acetyltransferase
MTPAGTPTTPAAPSPPAIAVEHDLAGGRFHAAIGGLEGECLYRRVGEVMQIVHTEVDPRLRSRGVAAALVEAAFAYARQEGLRVLPLCSYVRAWVRRHPAVHPLLA